MSHAHDERTRAASDAGSASVVTAGALADLLQSRPVSTSPQASICDRFEMICAGGFPFAS
jgi:hypothetical protein